MIKEENTITGKRKRETERETGRKRYKEGEGREGKNSVVNLSHPK